MKIYFCGSIRGGRQDGFLYERIVRQLKQYGTVLTEVVGDPTMPEEGNSLVYGTSNYPYPLLLLVQAST